MNKLQEGGETLVDIIRAGRAHLLVNTISTNKRSEREAAHLRRAAVENGVPCLTSLDTARALLTSLQARAQDGPDGGRPNCLTIDEYCEGVEAASGG